MSFFAAAAAAAAAPYDDGPGSPVEKLAADAAARASVRRSLPLLMLTARSTEMLTKIEAHNLLAGTPHEAWRCGW